MAGLVATHVPAINATEAVLYLTDYGQRTLVPLSGVGVAKREPLQIDATLGGRAFRDVAMFDAETPDGRRRAWLPLLDGTARLGVMEITVDRLDERMQGRLRQLAGLIAEIIVAKNKYADHYNVTRRRGEMTLAAEMQWSILPPPVFTTPKIAISGALEPCYEIAGDTFDYAYDDDVARMALIDAMGHGFEATIMSAVVIHTYRHSRRKGDDLTEIYHAMGETFATRFRDDQFATAMIAELDARTGRLRWVSAGHPAPLLVRAGRAIGALECVPALPIGMGGEVDEVSEMQLEPGDAVLLHTDGVTEARSEDGEFFGTERLADFVGRAAAAGLMPAETMRRLIHAVLDHQGGELQDDATLLLAQWHGNGPE
ncbi:MAG TPA: PP2C family protein-serine/threonine phosphatase [Euzebyales bacterium]|nr:PP2C family protein-serine/threonine phosphatase [Euzebyales bacterium]